MLLLLEQILVRIKQHNTTCADNLVNFNARIIWQDLQSAQCMYQGRPQREKLPAGGRWYAPKCVTPGDAVFCCDTTIYLFSTEIIWRCYAARSTCATQRKLQHAVLLLEPSGNPAPDIIFVKNFHTSACSKFSKFTPKKRANRDILDLKYYIFGVAINLIGIISLFSNVYAHFINE